MFNQRAQYNRDARRVFSGKDSLLLNADGTIMATVEQFQGKVNVATTQYQPLGSAIQQSFITGYAVTLTITQCIVEDDLFIQELFEFFSVGRHAPHWTFQSTIMGYDDGTESRIIFRDCIPEGDIDLHNFSVGEIIKRNWNLHAQQPPELQKVLGYPSKGWHEEG